MQWQCCKESETGNRMRFFRRMAIAIWCLLCLHRFVASKKYFYNYLSSKSQSLSFFY